jgi:hypothetical protein
VMIEWFRGETTQKDAETVDQTPALKHPTRTGASRPDTTS